MGDGVRMLCLRHGESTNVVARASGALPLAPLTPRGRQQAAHAADLLRRDIPTRIYTSTARRARQTAAIIAEVLHVDVTALPELVEAGIGRLEGAIDPEIRAQTADVLHAWAVRHDLDRKVADGETGHQVVARVSSAFETIATAHPGETVAVVGHVASLTAALSTLCNLNAWIWGAPLPHAIPFLIERHASTWHCPTWPGDRQLQRDTSCRRGVVEECS